MASRVRVAASACLVASGLFMAGAGGAIALADPGPGYGRSDDRKRDDSIGDIVRRAFGTGRRQRPEGVGTRAAAATLDGATVGLGRASGREGTADVRNVADGTTATRSRPRRRQSPPTTPCPNRHGAPSPTPTRHRPAAEPRAAPKQRRRWRRRDRPAAALQAAVGPRHATARRTAAEPARCARRARRARRRRGCGGGRGARRRSGAHRVAGDRRAADRPRRGRRRRRTSGASAGPPPAAPRAVTAEPPAGRVPPPANVGSNVAVPNSSYRIGYTEYLRTAGLPQVAALAVPGLAGILVLTGAGGLVGYRQAKAGHAVRVGGTARFMR